MTPALQNLLDATKRPLRTKKARRKGLSVLYDANWKIIAGLTDEQAALITIAVNHFEELVSRLEPGADASVRDDHSEICDCPWCRDHKLLAKIESAAKGD